MSRVPRRKPLTSYHDRDVVLEISGTQPGGFGEFRIRHPMYAGKLIIAAATPVISGSLWFVPTTVYIFVATLRAMYREDRALVASLREYRDYRERTTMLVPWVL